MPVDRLLAQLQGKADAYDQLRPEYLHLVDVEVPEMQARIQTLQEALSEVADELTDAADALEEADLGADRQLILGWANDAREAATAARTALKGGDADAGVALPPRPKTHVARGSAHETESAPDPAPPAQPWGMGMAEVARLPRLFVWHCEECGVWADADSVLTPDEKPETCANDHGEMALVEVLPRTTVEQMEERLARYESLVARYRKPLPDGGMNPRERLATMKVRMDDAEAQLEQMEGALREIGQLPIGETHNAPAIALAALPDQHNPDD